MIIMATVVIVSLKSLTVLVLTSTIMAKPRMDEMTSLMNPEHDDELDEP